MMDVSFAVVLLVPESVSLYLRKASSINSPSYKATWYVVPVPCTATKVRFVNVLPSLTPSTLLSMVKVAHSINWPAGMVLALGLVASTTYRRAPFCPWSATWRVSSALWNAYVLVAVYWLTKNFVAAACVAASVYWVAPVASASHWPDTAAVELALDQFTGHSRSRLEERTI